MAYSSVSSCHRVTHGVICAPSNFSAVNASSGDERSEACNSTGIADMK